MRSLLLTFALLFSFSAHALTTAEYSALNAAIIAEPSLTTAVSTNDDTAISVWCNTTSTFIVWRSRVTEDEYTDNVSSDSTVWSWPAYIARAQGERDGWDRMFRKGAINPGKANVRQGIADIFSGSANNAGPQRTHLLAMSKRAATNCEKVLATGTGTTATPGVLTFEGSLSSAAISRVMRGPW